ncbi:hypothetical protein ACPPVW_10995 [Leifsonia sp. McL0607]|uniref:hypothetical protein n=1 Tax=Leifsonia sp. McL0607 TaxID=3415672 RepID=UPI003CF43EFD
MAKVYAREAAGARKPSRFEDGGRDDRIEPPKGIEPLTFSLRDTGAVSGEVQIGAVTRLAVLGVSASSGREPGALLSRLLYCSYGEKLEALRCTSPIRVLRQRGPVDVLAAIIA